MLDAITCPHCGQAYDAGEAGCPACGHLSAAVSCERHPERTAAGQCVLCGSPVCDECTDSDRTHYSCPEHREIPVVEGWAQVYTTGDAVEASLIRDNLVSEGIDAEILSQKDRSFAVEMGDLSPVRVLVPAFEYASARDLIASHMDAEGEVRFACPGCGEAYDEGAEICVNCGQALR